MPIAPEEPPAMSVEVARSGVANALSLDAFADGSWQIDDFGGSAATDLAAPHETFTLPLNDVHEGGIGAASATGWRYVVATGDDVVGIGETSTVPADTLEATQAENRTSRADEAGNTVVFAKLDTRAQAEAVVRAIHHAESIAPDDEEYSVRYLRVPALFASAIWLHGAIRDWILPLDEDPDGIDTAELVPADVYLDRLAPVARRKLRAYAQADDDDDLGG